MRFTLRLIGGSSPPPGRLAGIVAPLEGSGPRLRTRRVGVRGEGHLQRRRATT